MTNICLYLPDTILSYISTNEIEPDYKNEKKK